MKTKINIKPIVVLAIVLAFTGQSRASTFVSGNVSGTWNTAGSPYVATANLAVPSGQTLVIQPGVTLIMGQGLNMDVEGTITAVGSGALPIIIRGANSSLYWDKLYINYTTGAQSSFANCNISDATNAIYLRIYSVNASLTTKIDNCNFANIVASGVYGDTQGYGYFDSGCGLNKWEPNLATAVRNCRFTNCFYGCRFFVHGSYIHNCGQTTSAGGHAYLSIQNCIFQSIAANGLSLESANYPGISTAMIANNIFVGCTNAVAKTDGASVFSDQVVYNCFFGNANNFVGYPAGVYGTVSGVNNNGTPCDLANNIFENPLFAETINFTLATNSPGIDAGTPDWALSDMCFPPSQGTSITDMGIYGGPHAANWLSVVPKLPAQLSLSQSNSFFWLNWGAIPRSTYQVLYSSTNFNAPTGTNRWLTNSILTAVDKPVSIAVSPYPPTNSPAFFRVQSLGRTPGN